jgi:hypothetical protein
MHHRFAQPLQVQLAQLGHLVDKAREDGEFHERGRPMRRSVAAKLNRAHLAAQVALANGLNLNIGG